MMYYILRWLSLIGILQQNSYFPSLIPNINIQLFDPSFQQNVSSQSLDYSSKHSSFEFLHGVASGDPTNGSVILWTRITPEEKDTHRPMVVFVSISNNTAMEDRKSYAILTTKDVDYTVKVDITGLAANCKYFYQFSSPNGAMTEIGSTRTLPEASEMLEELNLAVYSCSDYGNGFFTAYSMSAIKKSVDFVIHLGDYIYEYQNGDYTDGTKIGRIPLPDKELFELDDYRQRYAFHRRDVDLQLSHAAVPWIVVWDDHELADNSWSRGSVNSHGVQFLARKKNFLQAYFEWMPIRPQADLIKIWRQVKFGMLADLYMLDTRHYSRDVTDTYDNTEYIESIADRPERTMMGFDQEQWLYRSLNESDANWKFVGSQTVVNTVSFHAIKDAFGYPVPLKNYDSFDGYTRNRQRFIDAITSNHINDVILLSGDFHISWVHEIFAREEDYDSQTGNGSVLVEFAVTGITSPSSFPARLNVEQCLELSQLLVTSNKGMIWNEGWFRGYTQVKVRRQTTEVEFFGVDVKNPQREELLLATFTVDKGTNKVKRNFGQKVKYGFAEGI